jgi:hypothetical protein
MPTRTQLVWIRLHDWLFFKIRHGGGI